MSAQLIARLLEQRRRWVPLTDGVEVLVQRPAEAELGPYLLQLDGGKTALRAGLDQVKSCVVGWRGMTEAVLFGPAIGGDEAVDWSPDLWAVVVVDRHEWVRIVSDAVVQHIAEHYKAQEGASGN